MTSHLAVVHDILVRWLFVCITLTAFLLIRHISAVLIHLLSPDRLSPRPTSISLATANDSPPMGLSIQPEENTARPTAHSLAHSERDEEESTPHRPADIPLIHPARNEDPDPLPSVSLNGPSTQPSGPSFSHSDGLAQSDLSPSLSLNDSDLTPLAGDPTISLFPVPASFRPLNSCPINALPCEILHLIFAHAVATSPQGSGCLPNVALVCSGTDTTHARVESFRAMLNSTDTLPISVNAAGLSLITQPPSATQYVASVLEHLSRIRELDLSVCHGVGPSGSNNDASLLKSLTLRNWTGNVLRSRSMMETVNMPCLGSLVLEDIPMETCKILSRKSPVLTHLELKWNAPLFQSRQRISLESIVTLLSVSPQLVYLSLEKGSHSIRTDPQRPLPKLRFPCLEFVKLSLFRTDLLPILEAWPRKRYRLFEVTCKTVHDVAEMNLVVRGIKPFLDGDIWGVLVKGKKFRFERYSRDGTLLQNSLDFLPSLLKLGLLFDGDQVRQRPDFKLLTQGELGSMRRVQLNMGPVYCQHPSRWTIERWPEILFPLLDAFPIQKAIYANVSQLEHGFSVDEWIALAQRLPAVQTFVMGLGPSYPFGPPPVHPTTFPAAMSSGLPLEQAQGSSIGANTQAMIFPHLRQLHHVASYPSLSRALIKQLITNLRPRIMRRLHVQVFHLRWPSRSRQCVPYKHEITELDMIQCSDNQTAFETNICKWHEEWEGFPRVRLNMTSREWLKAIIKAANELSPMPQSGTASGSMDEW
ncbi:hypothetical protein K474DRAFT_1713706 [Panus rudis PR-1116 ss-1]|nr:hypothetical protein K474DRAFT_1713706 [Panus rudis PR-1116 ss-1]